MLEEARSVAAEHGVTQQARYFKEEAENHDKSAIEWMTATKWSAGVLVFYSIVTLFLHRFIIIKTINQ